MVDDLIRGQRLPLLLRQRMDGIACLEPNQFLVSRAQTIRSSCSAAASVSRADLYPGILPGEVGT